MKNALAIPPTQAMPKMSKSKKSNGDNRGAVDEISIRPADNGGATVRCSFEPKHVDPKRNRWDQMPEPEECVFESIEKALEHVGKRFRGEKPKGKGEAD